jgi:hypothetical protein
MRAGDAVLVSGAAGATGSVAGQLARAREAGKVVGIAGSSEKCAWLTDELGFDAAINYKSDDVRERLAAEFPDGIDLYFDNVGGELLDHVLARIANHARIVLCGAISSYTDRRLAATGAIKTREHVIEGLERAPEALNMLFTGANTGKTIVRVG